MKAVKASKLVEMSVQELNNQLNHLKEELFNLRFQQATGQLNNPVRIREVKKDIARVKTILRDREIKAVKQA